MEIIQNNILDTYCHGIVKKMPLSEAIEKSFLVRGEKVLAKDFYENSIAKMCFNGSRIQGIRDLFCFSPEDYLAWISDENELLIILTLSNSAKHYDEDALCTFLSLEDRGIFASFVNNSSIIYVKVPANNLEVEFVSEKRAHEIFRTIYRINGESNQIGDETPVVTIVNQPTLYHRAK